MPIADNPMYFYLILISYVVHRTKHRKDLFFNGTKWRQALTTSELPSTLTGPAAFSARIFLSCIPPRGRLESQSSKIRFTQLTVLMFPDTGMSRELLFSCHRHQNTRQNCIVVFEQRMYSWYVSILYIDSWQISKNIRNLNISVLILRNFTPTFFIF